MAPTGPPSDPSDRPADPRGRDEDDWDWGGDWDDGADGGGRAHDDRRQGDDARGQGDGVGRATGDPARGDRRGQVAQGAARGAMGSRRPRRAVRSALLALVVVAVTVTALVGGGDDDGPPGRAPVPGDRLRSLTAVAARAGVDLLERSAAVERYARIGRPIFCGAGRRPWVALTLDDGPGDLSERWIARMAKQRVPLTLFRIGREVAEHEEAVRVQRNLGWDSGSHTQNHPALGSLGPADQRREIAAGVAANRRVLGRPPRLFRPPYESHDATTDRLVKRAGLLQVLWNVDTADALGDTSADEIVAAATKGMRPGSIILLHEVKPNTLEAMPRILAAMREKGLEPVTVTRMLAGDGPSGAQLRKGFAGCRVDVTPGRAAS